MQAYEGRKMRRMYPWQAAALECGQGSNLVYCAPTSGGKSLVAEVLLIQRLLATAGTRRVRCSSKHKHEPHRLSLPAQPAMQQAM